MASYLQPCSLLCLLLEVFIYAWLCRWTFLLNVVFVLILFMMYVWWRDIIREGTFEGQHTETVQTGLRMGMLLFIVSEIMFFFAFFWAFFHSSFNPSVTLEEFGLQHILLF